ncbi:MAG TPA: cobalamin-independent methionine synthase II family protein [Candidatus Binatia bacterium]|jgi:5-methyltetrahydropteroyltriglutamate--homocysteine methyltransferase|nr:cobalamin-independent methionine synthase II family protein [Candidatus Binatia bacterium]
MKRSTQRILTTHVGSLARPDSLIPALRLKERGHPYDRENFAGLVREAVADVIRKQVEAGIDIVTDGEQGKPSFFGYIVERFHGFTRKPAPPGEEGNPRAAGREYLAFPDYYAWSERIAEWAGGRGGDRTHGVDTCTGPVSYKGHAAVQADIDNLKAALQGLQHEEVFLPAIAASYIAATLSNEYYRTTEEYEQAVADALREEYKAIIAAGFILQLDDPRLVTYYMMNPGLSVADCRKWAAQRVEAINYSIRDLPPEKIRFHTCYSIDVGPRIHEMELKDIVDIILKINAGAYSFEAANPRHEHEYHVFERVRLPEGKILIPGVISHTTNLVEHPELIAERIVRFAKLVGRENVIAGADCGFAAAAVRFNDTHPSVAWLKFVALAEGARLATKQLWDR